jgi:ribonucleoside-diphosphate reductase alpha chain
MSALMAKEHGRVPGLRGGQGEHAPRDPQPPPRGHGEARDSSEYENLRDPPGADRPRLMKRGQGPARQRGGPAHARGGVGRGARLGEKHGYRNAQTTVIAPTGTIGLLMDCDTTGVEPDFALVKFKKLAGGGYFKIANESVEPALKALGYSDEQVKDIMTYLLGTLSLWRCRCPHGRASGLRLLAVAGQGPYRGRPRRIERSLPGVFELSFAFSAWSWATTRSSACGIDPAKAKADPSVQPAQGSSGLSGPDRRAQPHHLRHADDRGRPAPQGRAPAGVRLREQVRQDRQAVHRARGHIRMMAAAQPFISGAISKTINLPNEATVEDIKRCYRLSWELGLKANALYRDGCKLSQPLSADGRRGERRPGGPRTREAEEKQCSRGRGEGPAARSAGGCRVEPNRRARVEINPPPMRRRLPDTRRSSRTSSTSPGHEGYLTVGLYEDGSPASCSSP